MFGNNKKVATSLLELLILLAIVGLLSVIYQKTIKRDSLPIKYAYKNVMANMASYASTVTRGYVINMPLDICNDFFETVNTVGEKNCDINVGSIIPNLPNMTTINGMRFFGLTNSFSNSPADGGERYVMISVDLDGVSGDNRSDKDILTFELLYNGRIRPSGSPIKVNENYTKIKGNAARDPELYSVTAMYVEAGTDKRTGMGNRLSYSEAQCLTGNPFPYREKGSGKIQMCVEDSEMREAIETAYSNGQIVSAADIKKYWDKIKDGSICDELYEDKDSVAYGLTKANSTVISYCKKCYKAAYKAKFCSGVTTATSDCPEAIIQELGICTTPEFVDN